MSGVEFYKLLPTVVSNKDLTFGAKVIYSIIVNYIGKNVNAWPSEDRLMMDAGCSKKAVIRAILNLEENGFLDVDRRGKRLGNYYSLPKNFRGETTLKTLGAKRPVLGSKCPVLVAKRHPKRTIKELEKKIKKMRESETHKDTIYFCSDSKKFQGITQAVWDKWQTAYPQADIQTAIDKAAEWAADLDEEVKYPKKLIEKFLNDEADHDQQRTDRRRTKTPARKKTRAGDDYKKPAEAYSDGADYVVNNND